MVSCKRLIVAILLPALAGVAAAQSSKLNPQDEKGYTAYAEFGGTANSDGQVYRLDSSVGYNFSKHVGADVGLPIYFVRASSTTGSISNNSIGNPYLDFRLRFNNPAVNYGSVLTGFVPAADSKRGMSTGRATFDWTNHFDHTFSRLTPFLEAGMANTIVDSPVFIRPYTTLGFNTHFQGGATFDLWKSVSVGASAYDILPSSQQTVFSKVVGKSGNVSNSSHGGVFETSQQTSGSADLAKDDGYSAWIGAHPNRYMDLQLGYTRSVHYALNSVSFGVGFNLGALARRGPSQ